MKKMKNLVPVWVAMLNHKQIDNETFTLICRIAQRAYEGGRYDKHTELMFVRDLFNDWLKNCDCTCEKCTILSKAFIPLFAEIELNND